VRQAGETAAAGVRAALSDDTDGADGVDGIAVEPAVLRATSIALDRTRALRAAASMAGLADTLEPLQLHMLNQSLFGTLIASCTVLCTTQPQ
jgi:hypothetical protein